VTPKVGRFHVITDATTQTRFSHVELAEMAIAGGADTIQFRDKTSASGAAIETAKVMRAMCRRAGVTFIVNDRLDIALASDADGVHLGRRDLPIEAARHILGPSRLIGGSASTLDEARDVERNGADYVGFGHVFPTVSKQKPGAARGPEALRAICDAVGIPVIAIGGIDAGRLEEVMETGAWGIAVIGAVCGAADPRGAAARIAEGLKTHAREGRAS
jgi:thiamine-phosphate pyrophosphorylase